MDDKIKRLVGELRGLVPAADHDAVHRAMKLAEIRLALPIWYRIDPDGAREIEKEVNHEQTNR